MTAALTALSYLVPVVVALFGGAMIGARIERRHEAERLDIALALRSVGEAKRCPDHVKVPNLPQPRRRRDAKASAWDYDVDTWTEAAANLDTALTDYTPKET